MDKLIYTAVSGAERSLRAQQVRANNLANADTPGFRANSELASSQALAGAGYDGVHLARLEADAVSTHAGTVRETGRPLDVALSGDACLAVEWDGGEAYTRAGAIAIDGAGALTVNGRPLLGEGGPIVLPPHAAVDIANDGTISIIPEGGTLAQAVDRLLLVSAEGRQLGKNEAGLLVARDGAPLAPDPNGTLRSRALEGSNVSAVEEMVAVMALNRSFELQMKMFRAGDSMIDAGNRLLGA